MISPFRELNDPAMKMINPYPSILMYGRTLRGRPIHLVCAYAQEEDMAVSALEKEGTRT